MVDGVFGEVLARRAIEDAGFAVHDANLVFQTRCPNIDLIVYGKKTACYVQVKSSRRPSSKGHVTIDGTPWSSEQLYQDAPIYNRRNSFIASYVILVDVSAETEFYIATPDELTKLARPRARKLADRPKRDGTRRSLNFRKELSKELLVKWRNAWSRLGDPLDFREKISRR